MMYRRSLLRDTARAPPSASRPSLRAVASLSILQAFGDSTRQRRQSGETALPRPHGASLAEETETTTDAIADQLAYILMEPATTLEAALKLLTQIFDLLASPEARLCLRVQGSLPKLLTAVADAGRLAARSSIPGKMAQDWPSVLHAAIVHSLSLEASTVAADVLNIALDDLVGFIERSCNALETALAELLDGNGNAEADNPSDVHEGRTKTTQVIVNSQQPLLQPTATMTKGLLKRKRGATLPDRGFEAGKLVLARILQRLQSQTEEAVLLQRLNISSPVFSTEGKGAGIDAGIVALMALRRLLAAQVSLGVRSDDTEATPIERLVVCLEAEMQRLAASGTAHMRLLLLWEVAERCLKIFGNEAACWDSVKFAFAIGRPLVTAACSHLCQQMDAIESGEKADRPEHIEELCCASLRVMHTLMQNSACARFMIEHLPCDRQDGLSACRKDRAPTLLHALATLLGISKQGPFSRLVLGVLANAASQDEQVARAIAALPVSITYPGSLLRGPLLAQASAEASSRVPDHAGNFLDALTAAVSIRSRHLFGYDVTSEEGTKEAEARVSCAVAAVLLARLVKGDPRACSSVARHMGSLEALVDVLRVFTVFQDKCGSLTNMSLLSLHAVMHSLTTDECTAPCPPEACESHGSHCIHDGPPGASTQLGLEVALDDSQRSCQEMPHTPTKLSRPALRPFGILKSKSQ
eukprot:TRINITY_DN87301_c0_g1_i1.p1 TRINITY_DN87301_c0_g1~~TRINITY_DN87301_c0_g1_i1.p1  ORF type:complete len:700 (-),score=119.92 TRINITY_DN87301_c0_g1_i1:94-2193(-)